MSTISLQAPLAQTQSCSSVLVVACSVEKKTPIPYGISPGNALQPPDKGNVLLTLRNAYPL
jgi:hypothetical protein